MSREDTARGWVARECAEAIERDTDTTVSPALAAITEILGGLVIEVAALNDQLARDHTDSSPVRVVEL